MRGELAVRELEKKEQERARASPRRGVSTLKTALLLFSQWQEAAAEQEADASDATPHPVHVVCTLHEFAGGIRPNGKMGGGVDVHLVF